MQPVQLSLLPETCPAPSATLAPNPSPHRSATTQPLDLPAAQMTPLPLPEGKVAEAVALMGRLIAEAAAQQAADEPGAGDE